MRRRSGRWTFKSRMAKIRNTQVPIPSPATTSSRLLVRPSHCFKPSRPPSALTLVPLRSAERPPISRHCRPRLIHRQEDAFRKVGLVLRSQGQESCFDRQRRNRCSDRSRDNKSREESYYIPEDAQLGHTALGCTYQRFQKGAIPLCPAHPSSIQGWDDGVCTSVIVFAFRLRANAYPSFRETVYAGVADPNSDFEKLIESMSQDMMKQQLKDKPELWPKLTPNYPTGCKRVIICDGASPIFP